MDKEYYAIVMIPLFLFLIQACSTPKQDLPEHIQKLDNLTVYSTDTEPAYQINFMIEESFGDTENVLIGNLWDMAVDNSGRIFIADSDQRNIKAYAPGGNFLTTLGRQGEGPGEFSSLTNLQVASNRLFAFDNSGQRINIFSLNGLEFSSTINIADNRSDFNSLDDAYLGSYHVKNDGTFLVNFSKSDLYPEMDDWEHITNTEYYYWLNSNGQIASDSLFAMKSSTHVLVPYGPRRVGTPVPYFGALSTSLSNENQVYVNWSDDFLVKVFNKDGIYQRAFYYSYKRVELTQESAEEAGFLEGLGEKIMTETDLPQTWPAVNSILIDDQNRLWISTITNDMKMYQWCVLQDDGKLLARFSWPRNKEIKEIKDDKLYTIEETEETGVKSE